MAQETTETERTALSLAYTHVGRGDLEPSLEDLGRDWLYGPPVPEPEPVPGGGGNHA